MNGFGTDPKKPRFAGLDTKTPAGFEVHNAEFGRKFPSLGRHPERVVNGYFWSRPRPGPGKPGCK